jgi:2-haloacid dehalogenase
MAQQPLVAGPSSDEDRLIGIGGIAMTMDRRTFLRLSTAGMLAGALPDAAALAAPRPRFRAIAFDGFPIFDPRPVAALAESLFPGHGTAIINAWRTRQFEYQWLRALSRRYADFLQVTDDSLVFAFNQLQLHLAEDERRQLLSAFSNLPVWPDVPDAIRALHAAGIRMALLSNMTPAMLNDGLGRAGLATNFEAVLSTDPIRSYKPDPKAYQLALDSFRLTRDEILFVAFAGWDAAGAKWFGYPTFWVNRLGAPTEELGVAPDASGADLTALVQFVLN